MEQKTGSRMNWLRKSITLASLGGLGLLQSASAQENGWRVAASGVAEPIAVAVPRGISLGKPAPLAANHRDDGVRQVSHTGLPRPTVVRAVREFEEGEPDLLYLPKDLSQVRERKLPPPMIPQLPTLGPAPARLPAVNEIDPNGTVRVIQGTEKLPMQPRRIVERPIASSEPCLDVDDRASLGEGYASEIFDVTTPRLNRGYVTAEWLHWATNGYRIPTMVTTSDPSVPLNNQGVLGLNTTRVLYGPGNVLSRMGPGARLTFGFQPNPCSCCWWEAGFFVLAKQSEGVSFNSNTTPVIGRPYFEINNNAPFRELTTTPGLFVGRQDINMSTSLWGAEINRRCFRFESDTWRISSLVGFRYLDLRDTLSVTEDSTAVTTVPGVVNAGTRALVLDRFDTRNQFYGGQVGLNAEWRSGRWSVDARFKFALGGTNQSVDVEGRQRVIQPNGATQNFVGGLYALSSNIGLQSQTRLSFVPEVGLKIGYDITDNIRVFIGYDLIYWSTVVRPGDQIDQSLDTNLIPNAGVVQPIANQVRPRVPFHQSNFWAQGVNAGLEFKY